MSQLEDIADLRSTLCFLTNPLQSARNTTLAPGSRFIEALPNCGARPAQDRNYWTPFCLMQEDGIGARSLVLKALPLVCALALNASALADPSAEYQQRLAAHYALERPNGKGPFPSAMIVPGCSGFSVQFAKSHYARVAQRLKDEGFVVLRVDYLAARGMPRCASVPQGEIARDISIAAEYLRAQTFVKKAAVNVLAWSYGAGAALVSLTKEQDRLPAPVNAVVGYFPACLSRLSLQLDVPVLILFGAKDDITPLAQCEAAISHVSTRNPVKTLVFPHALHGFDNADLPTQMTVGLGTVGYNEQAARTAWEEIQRFLRR